MLKEWQFNVLFFVGVGGAVLLLLGPELGLEIASNPTAVTGVGAILTYVLTQKKALTKSDEEEEEAETPKKKPRRKKEGEDGVE
jgi:hypothetical protein